MSVTFSGVAVCKYQEFLWGKERKIRQNESNIVMNCTILLKDVIFNVLTLKITCCKERDVQTFSFYRSLMLSEIFAK